MEALTQLNAAVAARADEGLQVPTGSQQYIDYMPHIYLAIANHMAGDIARARRELQLAETSGVAAKSDVGRSLLGAYELRLRDSSSTRPLYAVDDAKALARTFLKF